MDQNRAVDRESVTAVAAAVDQNNATEVAAIIDPESVSAAVAAPIEENATGVAAVGRPRGHTGGMWRVELRRT